MGETTEGTGAKGRKRRRADPPTAAKGPVSPKLRAAVRPITHRRIRGLAILRGTTVGALIDAWTAEKTQGMRFSAPGESTDEDAADAS